MVKKKGVRRRGRPPGKKGRPVTFYLPTDLEERLNNLKAGQSIRPATSAVIVAALEAFLGTERDKRGHKP